MGISDLPLDIVVQQDLHRAGGASLAGVHRYIFSVFVADVVYVGAFLGGGELFEIEEQVDKFIELGGVGLMRNQGYEEEVEVGFMLD